LKGWILFSQKDTFRIARGNSEDGFLCFADGVGVGFHHLIGQ